MAHSEFDLVEVDFRPLGAQRQARGAAGKRSRGLEVAMG